MSKQSSVERLTEIKHSPINENGKNLQILVILIKSGDDEHFKN